MPRKALKSLPFGETVVKSAKIDLMARNKVTVEVESYDDPAKPSIKILSHWNREEMVVIKIGDEEITVVAGCLIAAIQSATKLA